MKRMKTLLISVCCVLLLFTTLCSTVFADQSNVPRWSYGAGSPPQPDGEFAALGGAKSAYASGTYYIIETETELLDGTTYDELLYISLPIEGGFRVQAKHEYQKEISMGAAGEFEPASLSVIDVKTDSTGAQVLTGTDGTSVKIVTTADGFKLTVNGPKYDNIISLTNKQISYAYDRGEVVRTRVELPVSTDGQEVIHQGGETFDSLNRVGKYKVVGNVPNTRDPNSFANVPMMHSNRGYTIWFNMSYHADADIAKTNPKKATFNWDGEKMDFFIWAGTVQENLKKYTALTGASGVHEEYAYSFWGGGCTAFYKQEEGYVEAKFLQDFFEGYLENYGFYPRVMGGESSFYTANLVQYQKQRGAVPLGYFHPVTGYWLNSSYDSSGIPALPVLAADGTVEDPGMPFPHIEYLYNQGVYATVGAGYYDGSNPNFKKVIVNRYGEIMDRGMMGYMEDFGEKYSFRGISWNGLAGTEMRNLNPYYIAKAHDEVWTERAAGGQILYARSGWSGIQTYAGNFLGDQGRNWNNLMLMLNANQSLAGSGQNNFGGDLFFNYGCGTDGNSNLTIGLASRHIALCATSPYFRQHGMHVVKAYEHGETINSTFGTYYYLRENIIPSIMDAQIHANRTAKPVVQSMMVAYPYQLNLAKRVDQYMFCDDFLVCAVTTESQYTVNAALPAGDTWYDLYTHKAYEGGQTVTIEAPYAYFPMLVRDGSVKAIDLPYSQILGAEMHQDEQIDTGIENNYIEEEAAHPSLLITPPDEEREVTIYTKGESTSFRDYEYTTEVYVNKPTSDSTFTITSETGSDRETILALGVTAASVSINGKEMKRLDHIPDYAAMEYGYYVEPSGLTTIMAEPGWTELEIVKGDAGYKPYTVEAENNSYNRAIDDDISTSYQLRSLDDEILLTLDYDEPQEIGRILVQWTDAHLASYDIEYSVDGENWVTLLGEEKEVGDTFYDFGENWWNMQDARPDADYTVSRGGGSADVISIEGGVLAQYICLVPQEEDEWLRHKQNDDTDSTVQPKAAIAEIQVFPNLEYTQIDEDSTPLPDYGDGEEDWEDDYDDWFDEIIEVEDDEWEDIDDDDDDDDKKTSGKGKKKKVVVTTGWPWWLIAIIIGGAILVITGLVLLFLLIAKKKKKEKAMAAAEAADTGDPTDFEGPTET